MAETVRERVEGALALPLGRRVPRGRLRWYLAACPEGREAVTCGRVRRLLPADVLEDAFVLRTERIMKFAGEWTTRERDLMSGYFVVATRDAQALSEALSGLSFPVRLAGAVGRGFAPVDEDAREFLESCMDATHTIRPSEAEIVSDRLRVLRGPLVGHEDRISRYSRKRRCAHVRMGGARDGFTLVMPLAIPVRR